MKTFKVFIVATVFFLVAFEVEAANWVKVVETNNIEFCVETESIRKVGSTIECWISRSYLKPQYVEPKLGKDNRTYQSTIDYVRYDCNNRTSQIIQVTQYSESDRKGDVIGTTNFDETDKPSRIIPDTIGEALLHFVCEQSTQK